MDAGLLKLAKETDSVSWISVLLGVGVTLYIIKEIAKLPFFKKPKEENKTQSFQQIADPAIIKVVEGIYSLLKLNGKAVEDIQDNQKEYIKVAYETKNEVFKINDTVQKDHNKFGKLVNDVGMISSETSADAHRNDGNFKTLIGKVEGVQKEISDFRLQVAEGKAKLA